jgi:hypothetical protein
MTVFAHCDPAGNIHAFILVNAPAGVSGGIVPKPGETVVEVQGVTLAPSPTSVAQARQIATNQRIATIGSSRSALIKKS